MRNKFLVMLAVLLSLVAACEASKNRSPAVSEAPGSDAAVLPSAAPTVMRWQAPTSAPEAQIALPGKPPSWLVDPGVNALAIVTGGPYGDREKSTYQISLFNAATGEHYDLILPVGGMFWEDPQTFGHVSQDGETLSLIDLTSGSVGAGPFEQSGFRLLGGLGMVTLGLTTPAMDSLLKMERPGTDGAFLVVDPQVYSSDLAFYLDSSGDEVHVHDSETGTVQWTYDPGAGFDVTRFAWSPTESQQAAITTCERSETVDACDGVELMIIDVLSGETLVTYTGVFSEIAWSPNAKEILYSTVRGSVYGVEHVSAPCVLNLETRSSECFESIPDRCFPGWDPDVAGPGPRHLGNFQWDRDGSAFYYLYRDAHYAPQVGGTDSAIPVLVSALCRFDLATRDESCPTQGVAELQGGWIEGILTSPDGRYAYLWTRGWEWLPPVYGFLDLRSGSFVPLRFSTNYRAEGYPPGPLWRPSLP